MSPPLQRSAAGSSRSRFLPRTSAHLLVFSPLPVGFQIQFDGQEGNGCHGSPSTFSSSFCEKSISPQSNPVFPPSGNSPLFLGDHLSLTSQKVPFLFMEGFSKYLHVGRKSSSNLSITKSPIQVVFLEETECSCSEPQGKG